MSYIKRVAVVATHIICNIPDGPRGPSRKPNKHRHHPPRSISISNTSIGLSFLAYTIQQA
jgi:hypothetical protein